MIHWTGSIRGIVTDQTGAAVAGSMVTASNVNTGVQTTTTSDRAGNYNLQSLPIGTYVVSAQKAGFNKTTSSPFALEIDQIAKMDFKLQVGAVTTTVDVAANVGTLLQTEDATLGTTLTANTLDNDGRLDAVVTTNGELAYILHNETLTANHWLSLLLVGHQSNRDAIEAVIKLTTAHGSQDWTLSMAGSYLSSNDERAHFGLGTDVMARSIEIVWPSGIHQTLTNIAGDRVVRLDEPNSSNTAAHK